MLADKTLPDLINEVIFHINNSTCDKLYAYNCALMWLRQGRWRTPVKMAKAWEDEAKQREKDWELVSLVKYEPPGISP